MAGGFPPFYPIGESFSRDSGRKYDTGIGKLALRAYSLVRGFDERESNDQLTKTVSNVDAIDVALLDPDLCLKSDIIQGIVFPDFRSVRLRAFVSYDLVVHALLRSRMP